MNARTEAEAFAQPDEITRHLRIPPHSAESEMALLGGLLLENRAWDLIADLVVESDFYRLENRLVFRAIAQLVNANRPADVITVWSAMQASGHDMELTGGLGYLASMAQYVPSASNIRRHAETVRERAVLRNLIAASDEIATSAFNPMGRPVAEIADEAERKIFNIIEARGSEGDEWESMEQMVVRELDRIQEQSAGNDERAAEFIPTGLTEWDDLLDGGLRPGQLVIVGGRPSMGKSALADAVALHAAVNLGLPVGKFSMEMENEEGAQRALSSIGKVPMHALRRPERMSDIDWSNLTAGVEKLAKVPFYSNDTGGLNINQIRTKARVLKRKRGLRLLVVDYLQLMTGTDTRAPRTYQLEEASRGLKSLAKELGIPIIALVQVGRGVEKEVNPMPKMSDIKDCGAIEQDADIILFIHRPIVANPDLGDDWRFLANCQMVKQRGGPTGKFDLMYVGKHTRFKDWPADTPIPVVKVVKAKGKGL